MNESIIKINKNKLKGIITKIAKLSSIDTEKASSLLYKTSIKGFGVVSKSLMLEAYRSLKKSGDLLLTPIQDQVFLGLIKMKGVRTSSGVTPVTVMTMSYPCPGNCIFCPNEPNMPKSYISNEPGAQRALGNNFDPYLQTFNRLLAYKNIGHPVSKVELIVIGGSWSFYPENYQTWFINRCFDALNDFSNKRNLQKKSNTTGSDWKKLDRAQKKNEKAGSRCVGLSIETRPDLISVEELIKLRKLGVTKVQIGLQSLNNKVLKQNRRGHGVEVSINAIKLLRLGGFKIQVHWMPNLLGSSVKKDISDYKKMFSNKAFRPDELKIYPCSLISDTDLVNYFNNGKWKPYTYEELINLISNCLKITPKYCRIDRIIRDISSGDILTGNRKSNLRQIVESKLNLNKITINEIRYREIKNKLIDNEQLQLKIFKYVTRVSDEYFLEKVTEDNKIAGFLRLSLPIMKNPIEELKNSAIIREVHVYGLSTEIGEKNDETAQHAGIGKSLILKAIELSRKNGFKNLSVISAVGTKEYYRRNNFTDGVLYQHCKLY